MILDSAGHVVWFHPLPHGSSTYYVTNFQVQHYQGQPVLTWWQGKQFTAGEDLIMDRSYRTVAIVQAGDGYHADLHEFQITPQGTALIDAVGLERADLSSVGGPADGTALDDVIQEIDIKTGRVLWTWHSLGHVPVDASYEPYQSSKLWYDYFHLNSIQQLPNGNLLISARNTWAVYEISRKTGRVIWTLGGKYSNFSFGRGVHFEWQHDARLHPGRILSLFDDGSGGTSRSERQSSAKILRLDPQARTVSLVRRIFHSPPVLTSASGNTELLSNGNVFVGWGQVSEISEYGPGGGQIFNASFPLGVSTYRAFRFPWVGRPTTRPSIAVTGGARGHAKVYASWNGATQVRAWRVLGGGAPGKLKPLGATSRRTGFETAVTVRSSPRYFAVQALSANGNVLGTSAPTQPS